jgi:putative acetyltransferase
MQIREILPSDNPAVKDIIQQVILEHGAPKQGTAYSDAATQAMYENYQKPRSKYFVLVDNDEIVGCAGIAPLQDSTDNIVELQKMYFLPQSRGRGYGAKMMELCLTTARNYRFNQVYIETMDNMLAAQSLYRKFGFEKLQEPIGNTGHYSCPVQMMLEL